jgi:hypothetical protein
MVFVNTAVIDLTLSPLQGEEADNACKCILIIMMIIMRVWRAVALPACREPLLHSSASQVSCIATIQ